MKRSPALIVMSVWLVLLAACGKETAALKMSEDQALSELKSLPLYGSRGALGKKGVSAQALGELLQQLADSGQLQVKDRSAILGGKLDLSALNSLLGILQSGKVNSIMSLVTSLMKLPGASASGGKLSSILAILQAALPIIATIAPQFVPVITAITTILPTVLNFINMFKKPKSASVFSLVPVRS